MSWDRPSPAGHPSPGTRGPRGSGALSLPGGLSCLPALGVSDYWVLGTDFRDYAVIFTQLEFKDEAFSTGSCTVSRTELASQEAVCLFTRWSRGLGFLSQQQAALRRDRECPPGPPPWRTEMDGAPLSWGAGRAGRG
uniref:Lipocalin/cytosolic fatty-acid binding domain-containing protein n=1 Tax=Panthera leo TaxID=9689 RepID=A0A8C9D942_PANLE